MAAPQSAVCGTADIRCWLPYARYAAGMRLIYIEFCPRFPSDSSGRKPVASCSLVRRASLSATLLWCHSSLQLVIGLLNQIASLVSRRNLAMLRARAIADIGVAGPEPAAFLNTAD